MPVDRGTIVGETDVDRLTMLLADDNRDFFVDTYSFYLVALVLSGKSVFYGNGRFANLYFSGSRTYALPAFPANATETERSEYLETAEKKLEMIEKIHHGGRDEHDSENYYEIVSILGWVARIAVTSFLYSLQDPEWKQRFIQKRHAEEVTIRKTLQIRFWNELMHFFDQKYLAFRQKGNAYYIYIPSNASRNGDEEILKNVDQDGTLVLPEKKSAFYEAYIDPKEEKEPVCNVDGDLNRQYRVQRDSWDIRRYRIYLVRTVGDKITRQLKHLSPMKCYALYYGLCDRGPFLDMIQDPEKKESYAKAENWSDQMIAGLFKLEPSIPEEERNRISRENVKNYRQAYARELIIWLCNEVPGLLKSTATDLVTADDIRFEEIAVPFFRTHVNGLTKEQLGEMSEEKCADFLHNAYVKFVKEERTLKI